MEFIDRAQYWVASSGSILPDRFLLDSSNTQNSILTVLIE